jgi:hypothetical protein
MPVESKRLRLQLQAILQGFQGVKSSVQCLIFFDHIVPCGKQFSCSSNDRLFSVGDSGGHAILVGLEQGSGIKLAPA